jgi:predicted pyridoxine 5'-phosphate oxidase superfamily flavin-nucleotide-binding protein
MVGPGQLSAGTAAFHSEATFAAMAARDRSGRLWTSPLVGPPGLLRAASPTTLQIHTGLPRTDPLHGLPSGQPVGVIAMNFLTRRRVRINGRLTSSGAGALTVDVDQAYGNCPQYIHRRRVPLDGAPADDPARLYSGKTLRPEDIRLVGAADTFFLGTTHATAGSDASHRGGPPGFVRVVGGDLWWPDYPGNNLFNSFGNLAADPSAALLFVDFFGGITIQLSGRATVRWDDPGVAGAETGRRVQFTPEWVITTAIPALGETDRVP